MTKPITSGSAPKDWTPPEKYEKPPYQPPKAKEEWQPPNIIKGQYVKPNSPVIDGQPATVTQSDQEDVSPSELAKAAGVRPQMIYNYISQGLITAVINEQGRKRIRTDVANAWLEKYLNNKQERETQARDKLRRELNGE